MFVDRIPATGEAVLITTAESWSGNVTGYLVSLDGPTTVLTLPNLDFRRGYALLSPRFVYNTEAQRFFRVTPPIGLMALPRRLWALEGNPSGDYHVVRLP